MKRGICFLLIAALCLAVFSGCGDPLDGYVPTGDGLTYDEDYTGPEVTKPEASDQVLSMVYYPDRGMNPYLCTDFTNRALFGLLYQSLFVTDRNYNVEPMLCKSFSMSEDMKTYAFYLDDATFSDGTPVTPQDVEASLLAAMESDQYSGRFLHVQSLGVAEDGSLVIYLKNKCNNLPLLLDIPIVKASQVAENAPLGSGPYIFDNLGENACLRRRSNWWCKTDLAVTAQTITLIEAQSPTQIRDEFEFHDLSLVCADPGSDRYADYRCDYELWDCENGIFLYLATNEMSPVFSVPEVRQALTYAIDRDMLVEDYYRGFARSASLPASPLSPNYAQTLADQYSFDSVRFAQAINDAGLKDTTVKLLVNREDSLRLRVARGIGRMLADCGLTVVMSELAGSNYRYALQTWEFDLYLGQTKLSPNMDLTPFFSGSGALTYGGVNDVAANTLCQQALENQGNYYTLYQTVMDNGLLCPVLFRSYAVYATRGLLTGLTPARDNVFYYSIGKNMEQALIRE